MLRFTIAVPDDITVLRDLAHRIWHAHYPTIISVAQIDYMLERFFAPDILRQDLAAGVQWELAWHEQRPAGFLSWSLDRATARLKLSKVYLLPELHGRGLGQRMLEHVRDDARAAGARQIYLTVNKHNTKAVRAYERAGFQIIRPIVADIGQGFVMDDFEMALDLS